MAGRVERLVAAGALADRNLEDAMLTVRLREQDVAAAEARVSLFDALHFLRPAWLWALLALPAIAWLWAQRARRENAWRASVDAHLLPALLEPASNVLIRSVERSGSE